MAFSRFSNAVSVLKIIFVIVSGMDSAHAFLVAFPFPALRSDPHLHLRGVKSERPRCDPHLHLRGVKSERPRCGTKEFMVLFPTSAEVATFISARQHVFSAYTDSYRLCARHESSSDSLTIDLMGDTLLIQSWKDKIEDTQENGIRLADEISSSLSSPVLLKLFLSHRGRGIKAKNNAIDDTYADLRSSFVSLGRWGGGANATLREGGLRFATLLTPARDPGLHLDFRVGRRWLAEEVARRSQTDRVTVLNTFANTCTAGVVAAKAGAHVCNVDVSETCLADGQRNAALNNISMETMRYDAIPAMRMFAGLAINEDRRNQRGGQERRGLRPLQRVPTPKKLKPRRFSVVVLDPPTFAAGGGGVVDIVRDYNSLLKPALLALEDGGVVLATNHAASVDMSEWSAACVRCAQKCGRPLVSEPEILTCEKDIPIRPGTHGHLLKMLVLRI